MVALISAWGWRSAWFALAAISLLIPLPMVIFMMRDRPRQHPRISSGEIRYIEEATSVKAASVRVADEKRSYFNGDKMG